MKWFTKMIEVARARGVNNGMNAPGEAGFLAKLDLSLFWEQVEKAEVFVFAPKNKSPEHCDHSELYPEIDPSFESMSIEMLGDRPITSISEKDSQEFNVKIADIYCILNYEVMHENKRYYGQFLLMKRDDGFHIFSTNAVRPIVKAMLDRISIEDDGLEKTRQTVKIGSGKTSRIHRIRRIIHIRPKLKRDIIECPSESRRVDFSHRFIRRGHYRDIGEGKIGKNRDGVYCVSGETWVNESKPIGNPDKPLIKKVRFVGE